MENLCKDLTDAILARKAVLEECHAYLYIETHRRVDDQTIYMAFPMVLFSRNMFDPTDHVRVRIERYPPTQDFSQPSAFGDTVLVRTPDALRALVEMTLRTEDYFLIYEQGLPPTYVPPRFDNADAFLAFRMNRVHEYYEDPVVFSEDADEMQSLNTPELLTPKMERHVERMTAHLIALIGRA